MPEKKASLVEKLNEILRHEWTGVAQYAQAGFLVSGLWREVYAKMFFEAAEESFRHAKLIGEKIVALGAVPTIERNPVRQTNNLEEMLQLAYEFESAAVELYKSALTLAEDDRPVVVLLENLLLEEQQGVERLAKILNKVQAEAPGAAKRRARTG